MSALAALDIQNLTRRFGGLVAVDNVTMRLETGRLNAIIGPNGAGKTTLFNLVTGELKADSGRVYVRGQDISNRAPHQIVRAGVSRTLQIKSVFGGITVADNIRAAVMSHENILSPFRSFSSYTSVTTRVDELLTQVGLERHKNTLAQALSYGDVALLEIALALANEPRLILLDEPVCGMGPQETERAAETIKDLSKHIDVVIIEHDMELVFSIADHIVVLAQGAVLTEGTPKEISENAKVQEVYLGPPEDEE